MSTAVHEIVDLSFRDDLGLLFSRWLRQTDDAEVRQGYEAALAVAEPRHARYWLLDMRRRGRVSTTATRWVIETFLPRLVERLGGQVYLAYLLSPTHLTEASQDAGLPDKPAPGPINAQCQLQLFSDEHSALQWLHTSRHGGAPVTGVSAGFNRSAAL